MKIIKRNGNEVDFDKKKIASAITKANNSVAEEARLTPLQVERVTDSVVLKCEALGHTPAVEEVQDMVERDIMSHDAYEVAKSYILYRSDRQKDRTRKEALMSSLEGKFKDITSNGSNSAVTKGASGNANVNTDGPMGKMLQYGSEFSKLLAQETMMSPEFAEAHKNGDIHIHDLDFLPTKTLTCCQIDLEKLFAKGFSTGHGHLREPQSIGSYGALAAIALQANQNEQHGGQAIPALDFYLAPGVAKTFKKELKKNLVIALEDAFDMDVFEDPVTDALSTIEKLVLAEVDTDTIDKLTQEIYYSAISAMEIYSSSISAMKEYFFDAGRQGEDKVKDTIRKAVTKAYRRAFSFTDRATYQAMEGFIHNLNTMHSRAGAQVPFTSVNYGTDTSPEGRMVIKNILLATEAGLGNGETPIFPIQIFKLKEGVSYNDEDPNADLFDLACRVSAKRLFPNFSFIDSPFNLQYYKPGRPETEVAYMRCRTRVIGNVCGESTVTGRGNLSFTSINLPRLAIKAMKAYPYCDKDRTVTESKRIVMFFKLLDEKLALCEAQLLERMAIQGTATVQNFSFLMGEGVWRGSENLNPDEPLAEIIKQGTISIGFIGLAETLKALIDRHHGEDDDAEKLGLDIVSHMRAFTDKESERLGLNISLFATPAEGLSGRFTRMDKEEFGELEGITDKDYYTNSFHVPVYFPISAFEKIQKEAPFHALTNAGHISYIELDGDVSMNLDAFKTIVKAEKEAGMGYAAINHPVDRDPVCGYTGIIGNTCPRCGRREDGEGVNGVAFERIRRITGYLVGTMDKWNRAKAAEEADRVKHAIEK